MERWKGQVAVVAGATGGVGSETVKRLLNDGIVVVGIARCKDALAKISNSENFHVLQADITVEQDVLNAFKWITENVGIVHILVNNAGIGKHGNLIDGDTEKWKMILDTNLIGLCIATREAVKIMRANKVNGHIVNINSVEGHYIPKLPHMNVYPASKHGVTALTETFRQELNSLESKIKITASVVVFLLLLWQFNIICRVLARVLLKLIWQKQVDVQKRVLRL